MPKIKNGLLLLSAARRRTRGRRGRVVTSPLISVHPKRMSEFRETETV